MQLSPQMVKLMGGNGQDINARKKTKIKETETAYCVEHTESRNSNRSGRCRVLGSCVCSATGYGCSGRGRSGKLTLLTPHHCQAGVGLEGSPGTPFQRGCSLR